MPVNQTWASVLERALEIESQDHDEYWLGWNWHEVQAYPNTLTSMVVEGLIDIKFQSRSQTCYMLCSKAKAAEYLSAAGPVQPSQALVVPDNLFDCIVGHDSVKNILNLSIKSVAPVHVLLVGPVATAKSLFIEELARLPGSRLALGGSSSRAGIVDFLIQQRPSVLILDEMDKMPMLDAEILLTVMETGMVTRMKKNMQEQIHLNLRVYGAANDASRISDPLRSRFVPQQFTTYSQMDFDQVCASVLTKREGLDSIRCASIIQALNGKTLDVRRAVQVARLVEAGGVLDEIVSSMF